MEKLGLGGPRTVEEAMNSRKLLNYIQGQVDLVNDLSPSRAASIKKWVILKRSLSIETNDYTSTLKLKRNSIMHNFKPAIDLLYSKPSL